MIQTDHPFASPFLRLAAGLYSCVVRLRNGYYDRPRASWRAPLPVISVGNLTVGGTGKTPLVSWLARRIRAGGRRPAIVSRGYGGTAGRGPLIVSEGRGPLCPARVSGDEPHLLACHLEDVPIIVGSDRCGGAAAAARLGSDLVILDDGFQHRRLARDVDIVLIDTRNPFGNGRLLPAGLLREPVHGLARADFVVITRSRADAGPGPIDSVVRDHNPSAPILRAAHRTVGFVDARGVDAVRPERGVAFCGIGNPDLFRSDLAAEGIEVVEFIAHADHHPYTRDEIEKLHRLARERGAALITTEKDLARRKESWAALVDPPLVALRIDAEVFGPGPLLEAVDRVSGRAGKP